MTLERKGGEHETVYGNMEKWKRPERRGTERKEGRGGSPPAELCPPKEPTPSLPTFSHIPEYTAEGHVLKPENRVRVEARGAWERGAESGGRRRERTACPPPCPECALGRKQGSPHRPHRNMKCTIW